ncbi:Nn.00g103410.m01.CDS01 [Neocucurbitaria sp. VM-36]
MKFPRSSDDYRQLVFEYALRSYSKTIFQGFIYRFLVELLREDNTALTAKFPDLDAYDLAHLSAYQSGSQSARYKSNTFSFSQLESLVNIPLPEKGQGHVLFLCGHLPGSWISSIGAKYGITPEFFRRHVHLWRSSEGPVLHSAPRLPSVTADKGLLLRINTQGYSIRPPSNLSFVERRKLLPDFIEATPLRLAAAPGSSYVRGHAFLGDSQFLIEQDISITIESEGDSWTAVLWSDVGKRDLSKSLDFHPFIKHLTACSKTGFRSIRLLPTTLVGIDSELKHALPPLPSSLSNLGDVDDGSLVQSATHLASESHYLVDYTIAAYDPMYALTPVFRFAAATENQLLAVLTRRYEIISSTVWDPKRSTEFSEQLILHKHILDDHACRHEEVHRFLRSPSLVKWAANLTKEQVRTGSDAKRAVEEDYEYLLARFQQFSVYHGEAISILVSSVALAESKKQITLATQVTKLTVLATIFLPLSYCTSIFGMNFIELDRLRIWIWVVVTIFVGTVTVVVYQWDQKDYWSQSLKRFWGLRTVRVPTFPNSQTV